MTRIHHLTDEDLLELSGKTLALEKMRIAKEHLMKCSACRERAANFSLTYYLFQQVAQESLELRKDPSILSAATPQHSLRPWVRVAIAAACCLCMMVLLWRFHAPSKVNAAELLSTASRYETVSAKPISFRVQVEGENCFNGPFDGGRISRSARCNQALQNLEKTPWGHGNPLSVKTYIAWRNSLPSHQDEVIRHHASWEVKTSTSSSPVRSASLEMQAENYHVTQVTLDCGNSGEIRILEAPVAPPEPPATLTSGAEKERLAIDTAAPADLMEAQAWMLLHQLNADTGWEATVQREGSAVQIKAFESNQERKAQLEQAVANYPGLKIDFYQESGKSYPIFPERSKPSQAAPGLADAWLKQKFPQVAARAAYINQALGLSQKILGHAFYTENLQQRFAQMGRSTCRKDYSSLIQAQQQASLDAQMQLARLLMPLPDMQEPKLDHALSYAEAKRLDGSLEKVLLGSEGTDTESLEEQIQSINSLL